MRIFKIAIFLILAAVALIFIDKSIGSRQFEQKFGISDLPSGVEIEEYEFSGLGMDHHYLWKLVGDSSELQAVISMLKGKYVDKQSSVLCLSLTKEQAPNWWPITEIDDRLWRTDGSTFDLYSVPTTGFGVGCLFFKGNANSAYIQWFDT